MNLGGSMKTLGKILLALLLIPYLVIVIFLTACLLNYNDYNLTEFGRNTLIMIGQDEIEGFNQGDLVVVFKNKNKDINVGDNIFFYDTTSKENVVSYAKVENKVDITRSESTFTIEGGYKLSSEYVIGKESTCKTYKNVGTVLSVLESRWGFLFFVIFPIILIFMYEVYMLIMELRESREA